MSGGGTSPPTTPAPRRRRWLGWLLAAVALCSIVALSVGLTATPGGLQLIVRIANAVSPAGLEMRGASGTLIGGFAVDDVEVDTGTTRVRIEGLAARIASAGVRPWRIDFDELRAEHVTVQVMPSEPSGDAVPQSIASPLAVSAGRLEVGAFELLTGAADAPTRLAARAIKGDVTVGPDGYRVRNGRFEFGPEDSPLRMAFDGRLDGARPFAVTAKATLAATLRSNAVQAAIGAEGSLVELDLQAEISGGGGSGIVRARIGSFASPALQHLQADLKAVDPSQWLAEAPAALLNVNAELTPAAAEAFTLRGPVRIDNARPGPVDQRRIPAASAQGQIEWSAQRLRGSDVTARIGRGVARGSFDLGLVEPFDWSADASVAALDPGLIHGQARPMRIDGEIRASHRGSVTRVAADLRNRQGPAAHAVVALRIDPRTLFVDQARIELAGGNARIDGELALRGDQRIRLAGNVEQIDLGLLVKDLDARINGRFDVAGALQPQPAGTLAFEITDSRLYGRPLAGRGRATLGDQGFDIDAALEARSARLTARGSLGRPGASLTLVADVPSLKELALPADGALNLEASLKGDWRAPAVEARIDAQRLRIGEHTVQQVQGLVSYGGGSDGKLDVQATATDHRFKTYRQLSARSATLSIDGTASRHVLRLVAANLDNEPLALQLAGGWRDARWTGTVAEAKIGKPLDLTLDAPAPLAADLRSFRVGPARLRVAGAQVEDLTVEAAGGTMATSGRFEGFRPGEFRQDIVPPVLMPPARERLSLRGRWQLKLGAQADGELRIERQSGDLYPGTVGGPLGVTQLRLDAALRANRLTAEAELRGERLGELTARLQAETERSEAGWRLAQERPLSFVARGILPNIEWANALLSERVRANVRIGGSLAANVMIEGTPANPLATGGVTGTALRVAWIEQGVRLENGVLIARVEDDEILLDELRFSGPPRVVPDEPRAARAVGSAPGSVVVNGRLNLGAVEGVLQVAAERLPLLQRPDRWVVISGGANAVFTAKRVQLNGAAVADAGFVEFSQSDLPSLPQDVSVVLPGAAPAERVRDPQVQFDFDLGIDLGKHFYLSGRGLQTRVEGAIRVRNEGRGALRATGSVEARDGIYEGFGQRLAIERGRVNFQGPLENPGLDVLALRKGLPVEVGVAITRTAADPLIRLHSDPPMSDYEALSWLVLGRPAEQGQGDNAALARAAAGLLAGSGESKLMRSLGIDEITIRSGDNGTSGSILPRRTVAGSTRSGERVPTTVGNEIVVVGKRFSDAVTISYEQALSGTTAAVLLSYRLHRRVSLVARAGTSSALYLVYAFPFD